MPAMVQNAVLQDTERSTGKSGKVVEVLTERETNISSVALLNIHIFAASR